MLDQIDPFVRFTDIVVKGSWNSLFPALEDLCQAQVGHQLFSCSVFQRIGGEAWVAARVYSNDDINYPTSGLKEIIPNRWTEIVIANRETFIANSVAGFSDVFPDHEKIASLGLGSVINLPIILNDEFIGTVNLLHETGYYSEEKCTALSGLVLPCLLTFHLSTESA